MLFASCANNETDSLNPIATSLSNDITLHDHDEKPESAIHVFVDDTQSNQTHSITVSVDTLENESVEVYYDVNNDSTVNRKYRVYEGTVTKTISDYFFVKAVFYKDNKYHVIESYAIKDFSVSYKAEANN
ncbi:hypothetical protein NH26_20240 [Flammeovirga pacifica]|uniref:Uncharacterized protein n=1 Tax=Flammeovirga pacifica TaxID=915059 RepID=A0A1S1YSD1_FLAPC|nr:hypothetical protein NH26_20240 [Flammeovirga pacifica]